MKKAFLLLVLSICTYGFTNAQNTSTGQITVAENDRLSFAGKMNDLDLAFEKKDLNAANIAIETLQRMMTTRMNYTNGLIRNAADNTGKQQLTERLKTQQSLASEIKMLSVDLMTNKAAIKGKLQSFLKAY